MHHIQLRSQSGDDSETSLITFCANCHDQFHGAKALLQFSCVAIAIYFIFNSARLTTIMSVPQFGQISRAGSGVCRSMGIGIEQRSHS